MNNRRDQIWFPVLVHLAVCLPAFGAELNLPVAKDLSSHGVTVDPHPFLTTADRRSANFTERGAGNLRCLVGKITAASGKSVGSDFPKTGLDHCYLNHEGSAQTAAGDATLLQPSRPALWKK